jgi:DNA-binding LacI/PurR family transcriptional regulator
MGRAFSKSNRKNIVYIHIGEPKLAANSSMVCAGIVSALGNSLLDEVRFGVTSIPTGSADEVDGLLSHLWEKPHRRPDAICTRSIKVTNAACRFFERHSVGCPEEVSLIGPDDSLSANFPKPGLTVVKYNTESLAAQVLDLLVRRIDRGGEDVPGVYVPEDFGGFASTLPEENEVLSAPPPWANRFTVTATTHS